MSRIRMYTDVNLTTTDTYMRLIFPTILIALNVCASIVYAFDGDWRKAIFWSAAGVLNFVVTY